MNFTRGLPLPSSGFHKEPALPRSQQPPSRGLLLTARPLVLLLLVVACENSGPLEPTVPTVNNLPARFRLRGIASGSNANGRTADCGLDLIFELRNDVSRSSELVEYTGVHGGEVARTVLAKNGSGFSFIANVFGEVEARLHTLGRVELLIPINVDAEGRFWQRLARFEG